jgi:hypothetical protein
MSEMVERVAKAMHDSRANHTSEWQEWEAMTLEYRERSMAMVRDGIEAMRKPTVGMNRHLQMNTEMGAYVCENLTGAYSLMDEYQSALIDTALK